MSSAFIDSVFDKASRLGYVEMPLESLQLFVREIRIEQAERIRDLETDRDSYQRVGIKTMTELDELAELLRSRACEIDELTSELAATAVKVQELAAQNEKYRSALDAIYNHNEAARSAVLIHFGHLHPKDIATPILAERDAKTLEEAADVCENMSLYAGQDCANRLNTMAQELRGK